MSFASKLIKWYQANGRDLPWRNTRNPYIIWLSEVILQQTRVEQGLPYFNRFLAHYPNVTKFAQADEEEILRLWQGLGYYSRARNMHKAANSVLSNFAGDFPTSYKQLISLSGVGDYTAAAISSFSSNEAKAVLDGNVYRVLARYFGVEEPINGTAGKKIFTELANELLDPKQAGTYNQAIMDFGAMHCKPKNPLCDTCIFRLECVAYAKGLVGSLPMKNKAKASRNRYFHYFVLLDEGRLMMSQRAEGDVWTNLYEFPMIESDVDLELPQLFDQELFKEFFMPDAILNPIGGAVKHILSHQNIYARFYFLANVQSLRCKKTGWDYFLLEKIDKLAKHKLIFSFLERNKELINQ